MRERERERRERERGREGERGREREPIGKVINLTHTMDSFMTLGKGSERVIWYLIFVERKKNF